MPPFFVNVLGAIVVSISLVSALYDGNSDVVQLTQANFQSKVIDSDSVWIVEFFAPWCGHCKSLVPEYMKAAKALKGVVKVGAVDMTQHQSVGAPYNVQGFPTIKVFGANKQKPTDYQGQRTAQGLVDAGMNELRKVVSDRLGGKSTGGGGSKQAPPTGDQKDVFELTDSNFEETILGSEDMWLVEFFAPWCGHCKNLAPHWASAATQLKGKGVKLGAVDATVHTVMASRFGVRGYPTIKVFPGGKKSSLDEISDYDGGRTADDIVRWASEKAAANLPPPEVLQIVNEDVVMEACEKQLCIIAVLPDLLDCQSDCRNDYLRIMKDLAEKFKKNMWGWIWTAPGDQTPLEEALGIGGFGYPAMAAVNLRKMKFSILKGSFSYDGINEFLRDLSYGKGSTAPLRGAELPKIKKRDAWDGKDAEPPVEEDIDLSDVNLDKIEL